MNKINLCLLVLALTGCSQLKPESTSQPQPVIEVSPSPSPSPVAPQNIFGLPRVDDETHMTADHQEDIVFDDTNYAYVDNTVHQVGKRLIFIHGTIDGDHTMLLESPQYHKIITDLVAAGWQVILFDCPPKTANSFFDGGKAYKEAYIAKLRQALDWAETNVGHVTTNVIGGVSWGGAHALIGAALVPDFNAYFGLLPLTQISWLTELRGISTPSFDPFSLVPQLASKRGYFEYGTADFRVNFTLTMNLISMLQQWQAPVSYKAYEGIGHSAPANIDSLTQWVLSN